MCVESKEPEVGGDPSIVKRNVLYTYPTIKELAYYLFTLNNNIKSRRTEGDTMKIRELIQKNSVFIPHSPGPVSTATRESVLLTGAIGSLGGQVLYQLLQMPSLAKVCCVAQAENLDMGCQRISDMFMKNEYPVTPELLDKIVTVEFDYIISRLSVSHEARAELLTT